MSWFKNLTDMQGLMLFALAVFVVVYLVMFQSRPATKVGVRSYFQPNIWTVVFWVSALALVLLIGCLVSLYLTHGRPINEVIGEQWKDVPNQMCAQVEGCKSVKGSKFVASGKKYSFSVDLQGSNENPDLAKAQLIYKEAVSNLPWQLRYSIEDEPLVQVQVVKKGGKK
jgi:hypothetical protein